MLALNLPAGTNAALARVLGALLKQCWLRALLRRAPDVMRRARRSLLKQCWLRALLRRPAKMTDPAHCTTIWRPALFLCDEHRSFATVCGDDLGGDERAFALSRQLLCIPLIATQSLSSLRSATSGRDDWRTLLQTLRTKIFLSLEDGFCRQKASRLCGQSEFLKPNYSFSESANRAGVLLLSGSLSASRSYGPRLEAKFKPREFRELDNAQATVLPFLEPIEAPLADPEVAEIMVNAVDDVHVERRGQLERVEVGHWTDRDLERALVQIARSLHADISAAEPELDARLPDGSRVAAMLPPIAEYPALLHDLEPGERFVVIEDTAEINLQQPHKVRLEARRTARR